MLDREILELIEKGGYRAMADDTSAGMPPQVELDDEARRLALEAAKAGYRKEIVTAQAGMLAAAVPTIEGAPTGKTTLADKAGTYGPWLAHQALDATAASIAAAAARTLGDDASGVLVVERRDLLSADTSYQQVRTGLQTLNTQLDRLKSSLEAEHGKLRPPITLPQNVLDLLESVAEGRDVQEPPHEPKEPQKRAPAKGLEEVDEEAPSRAAPVETPVDIAGLPGLGALPAALGLLQLVSTDYDLAPASVSATSAELATLVAAHLPRDLNVFVDDFLTVNEKSQTLVLWQAVANARDQVASEIRDLSSAVAGVEAQVDVQAKRVTLIGDAWRSAATMEKDKSVEGRLELLSSQLAAETQRLTALQPAVVRAKSLVADAVAQLTAADAVLVGLAKPSDLGTSPLRTALAQERLHGDGAITHVLYVELNHTGADSQTRRLVLGESGRLGFMGSGNASWLLLSAAEARIVGGGHVAKANRMTYDLATGQASTTEAPMTLTHLPDDPALGYEKWAKSLIVVVALFLIFITVVAVINLALG